MGKVPLELPPFGPVLASVVASHPKRDVVAAGYQDGSVLLFRLEDLADIQVADAADAKVTGISFSCDGRVLGFVREDGSAGLLDLPL
jgi:WD40 repeat protein